MRTRRSTTTLRRVTAASTASSLASACSRLAAGYNATNNLGEIDVTTWSGTGDLNCDGAVNFSDINPFVLALTDEAGYHAAYPECIWQNADCNRDGLVNFDDINPFVTLLSAE